MKRSEWNGSIFVEGVASCLVCGWSGVTGLKACGRYRYHGKVKSPLLEDVE